MASEVKIRVSVVDNATAQLNKIKSAVGDAGTKMKSNFETATKASTVFAGGLAALTVAAGAAGIMGLKIAGDYEQTKIAFETLTGSAENAQKLLKDMADFAKRTPFELRDLENSTRALMAYGFEQKSVLANLEILGNIAAGVGMDKLPQLTLAYGQVKAATRLTGAELRQFTEAGVPLLDELAKHFDTTAAAVQEMISDGAVGFQDVQTALYNLTAEGGRFENLMEKQSKSFLGMLSNLRDAFNLMMREVFTPLVEALKPWLAQLVTFATDVTPKVVAAITTIGNFLNEHRIVLAIVGGAITGALIPAFIALAGVLTATVIPAIVAGTMALLPYIAIGAAIGAALYALYIAYETNFLGIRDTVDSFVQWLGPTFTTINTIIQENGGVIGTVKNAWIIAMTEWRAALELTSLKISTTFQNIKNWVNGTWIDIQLAWQSIWNDIGTWFEAKLNQLEGFVRDWYNRIISMINLLLPKFAEIESATKPKGGSSRNSTPARRAFGGFAEGAFQRFIGGGTVQGPAGIDNIPIWASAGELILNAAQQQMVAANLMAGNAGGGRTLVFDFSGSEFNGVDQRYIGELADEIMDYIEPHLSRNAYA